MRNQTPIDIKKFIQFPITVFSTLEVNWDCKWNEFDFHSLRFLQTPYHVASVEKQRWKLIHEIKVQLKHQTACGNHRCCIGKSWHIKGTWRNRCWEKCVAHLRMEKQRKSRKVKRQKYLSCECSDDVIYVII